MLGAKHLINSWQLDNRVKERKKEAVQRKEQLASTPAGGYTGLQRQWSKKHAGGGDDERNGTLLMNQTQGDRETLPRAQRSESHGLSLVF